MHVRDDHILEGLKEGPQTCPLMHYYFNHALVIGILVFSLEMNLQFISLVSLELLSEVPAQDQPIIARIVGKLAL
jgi:hypothetical protein